MLLLFLEMVTPTQAEVHATCMGNWKSGKAKPPDKVVSDWHACKVVLAGPLFLRRIIETAKKAQSAYVSQDKLLVG